MRSNLGPFIQKRAVDYAVKLKFTQISRKSLDLFPIGEKYARKYEVPTPLIFV